MFELIIGTAFFIGLPSLVIAYRAGKRAGLKAAKSFTEEPKKEQKEIKLIIA